MNLHTKAFAASRNLTVFCAEFENKKQRDPLSIDHKKLANDIWSLVRAYNHLRWTLNGQKLIRAKYKRKRKK